MNKSEKSSKKRSNKILIVGPLPPPYFGVPIMLEALSRLSSSNYSIQTLDIKFNTSVTNIEKFTIKKIFLFVNYCFQLNKKFNSECYDAVIFAHSFHLSAFIKDTIFISIALLHHSKVILYAHGQKFDSFYYSLNNLFKGFVDFYIHRTTLIVTTGQSLLKEYTKWNRYAKIDYVHNFVPDNFPKVKSNHDEQFPVTVLFLSAITRSKGIFLLLDAIKLLKEESDRIQFRICGDYIHKFFDEQKKIFKFLQESKINNIQIVGRVDGMEKIKEFSNADIFVFPTLNDAFGLVNLEAMSASLPIITTSQGAILEYITDQVNGFIVPENDAFFLADKIKFLVYHPEIRLKMGLENRQKYLALYAGKQYYAKWDLIVKNVIGV